MGKRQNEEKTEEGKSPKFRKRFKGMEAEAHTQG